MRLRLVNSAAIDGAPWHGALAVSERGAEDAPTAGHDVAADDAADEVPPWLLVNLSGDVASRWQAGPDRGGVLNPSATSRQAVVMTDAQIDQVAGLIGLRGVAHIDLFATPSVFEELCTTLPVLPELQRHCRVHWHLVGVAGDQRSAVFEVPGLPTLEFSAFDTGFVPKLCIGEAGADPTGRSVAIGVRHKHSGRRALFVRGLGAMAPSLATALEGLHCLVVDPGWPLAADDMLALTHWLDHQPVPRKLMLGALAGTDGMQIVL